MAFINMSFVFTVLQQCISPHCCANLYSMVLQNVIRSSTLLGAPAGVRIFCVKSCDLKNVSAHSQANKQVEIGRDESVDVLSSDWMQGDSAALHLFSGHQLLLDPGRRPLPPQPHIHGLPIRLQIPLGIHTHWMG